MMGFWGGSMGLWMVLGGLLMLVFWAGVIGLVVWGIAALAKRSGSGSSSMERRDALGIARERYARGEITSDEFGRIKSDLS